MTRLMKDGKKERRRSKRVVIGRRDAVRREGSSFELKLFLLEKRFQNGAPPHARQSKGFIR